MSKKKLGDSIQDATISASPTYRKVFSRKEQLVLRVEKVATVLTLMALFLICWGLFAASLFFAILVQPARQNQDYSSTIFGILGIAILLFGIFVFKMARDFRAFKKWTYGWAEFLVKLNWGFLFRKELYSQDVRKAFDQPEYEYPEFPEYGYKLEEKKENKRR